MRGVRAALLGKGELGGVLKQSHVCCPVTCSSLPGCGKDKDRRHMRGSVEKSLPPRAAIAHLSGA